MAPLVSPNEEFARTRSRALEAMRKIVRLARESQAEITQIRPEQFSPSDLSWLFAETGPVETFLSARREYDQALLYVYDKLTAQGLIDRLQSQWSCDQVIFDELEELLMILRNLFNEK
jgi:hypothetical protein